MSTQDQSKGKGTGKSYSEENTNQATQTSSQDKRKSFEQGQQSNDTEDIRNKEARQPTSRQPIKKEEEPVEEKSDTIADKPEVDIPVPTHEKTSKKLPEMGK